MLPFSLLVLPLLSIVGVLSEVILVAIVSSEMLNTL